MKYLNIKNTTSIIFFILTIGLPIYSIIRVYEENSDKIEENAKYAKVKSDIEQIKSYLRDSQETCGMYRAQKDYVFFIKNDFEFSQLNYELLPIKIKPVENLTESKNIIISNNYSSRLKKHKEYKKIFKGKKYSLY